MSLSLHPFDFDRNLFIFLFVSFFEFQIFGGSAKSCISLFTSLVWFAVVDNFFII